DRGAFAPARQEAIAALDALRENNTVDALAEFERATKAFENSLAQRAAMRADMAREDSEDYRRLGRLTYVSAPSRSLGAYREAAKLDTSDVWALIYLARLEQTHGDGLNAALSVLKTAGSNAANDRDRSVIFDDVGNVQTAQGDLKAALTSFQKDLEIRETLAEADPDNAEWQRDLSVSHNKIGDVQRDQGDLKAALSSFQKGLEIRETLAKADPDNAEWQRDVWVSLWRLREFESAGVSWADIAARMEAMQAAGTLLPTDQPHLEHARAEAAKDASTET
ncbi:MAG: hypothetical protein AAF719_07410, partial [Pseudomonadota bacterium]